MTYQQYTKVPDVVANQNYTGKCHAHRIKLVPRHWTCETSLENNVTTDVGLDSLNRFPRIQILVQGGLYARRQIIYPFYANGFLLKTLETIGFLFLGCIERDKWHKMG